jgi:hypothetical protein
VTSTDNNPYQPEVKKSNIPKVEDTPKIQLVALIKQGKTCAQATRQQLSLTNKVFNELALNQLCELYLQTDKSKAQVLLVAQDAYTVMPLTQSPQGWQIPLPKNRLSDRSYFLVSLTKTLSEEKIEALRLYRETMEKPSMLTDSALTDWLVKQDVKFTLFTHKLVVE